MLYNWQQKDWPQFQYDLKRIEEDLFLFTEKSGLVAGLLRGLPDRDRDEAIADILAIEAIHNSTIEGEVLSRPDVISSVRNQLGLNQEPAPVRDRASIGAAELAVSVREDWDATLTEDLLFEWHAKLLQGERSLIVGGWRTHETPMQVITPHVRSPIVHFEAPPSFRVPDEMSRFIQWFNRSRSEMIHAPIRSALTHLYFESVHPFEDGNGRIGRALSEKALSEGLGRPVLLSLSRAVEQDRDSYYEALKRAQKSNETTEWIRYFLHIILQAQIATETQVEFVLKKARFFERFRDQMNPRQQKAINRVFQEGPEGFRGGLNARKYKNLTEVSKATATRDLQDLVKKGSLVPTGAGRSARYEINL